MKSHEMILVGLIVFLFLFFRRCPKPFRQSGFIQNYQP